ncbi:hypothetical protein [Budvicia aquatica]|nr:hypothetical protein [Budvicia aquatica]VFS48200.1 Uncharacterised protein [Budvicia aquatica]
MPVAVLASVIVPVIYKFFLKLLGPEHGIIGDFLLEAGVSFFMGAIFILSGTYTAPSNRIKTARLLFVLLLIVLVFLFIFNLNLNEYSAAFYVIPTALGAYAATKYDYS